MTVIIICFITLLALGVPLVFVLGASALITLITTTSVPLAIVAQRLFAGLDSFTLMAIPFFVFAGVIMDAGGISRRIVDFSTALIGWITGSLLFVSCLAAAGLAAISGSGSADTAAISSIMQPQIKKRGYDVDFGAAIIACSGSIAQVIPPSLTMIVIAILGNLSIGNLFLAGVIPGILCILALMAIAYFHARTGGDAYRDTTPFSFSHLCRMAVAAIPAFIMPTIVMGGIVGGVFTPTESAAVACFYGLLVSLFVYREIDIKALPGLILKAVSLSSAVMLIIGTASIFSWLIANASVPELLGDWFTQVSSSPAIFLILTTVLFLIVGMFMETIAAILILFPVLFPISQQLGIDAIHFSLIIVLNCAIGTVTPPYGISLFVASNIANRTVLQVASKAGLPLAAMFATLILIILFPSLSLWLPQELGNF